MSADLVAPAVLNYISHSAYPDSEAVSSADLSSSTLTALLSSLREAQEVAKNDIRSLSNEAAPDIDAWIARAKELQADILRSRDTARQIVAEAERLEEVKAEVADAGSKVGLLEREVAFNESLAATLEQVRDANGLLESVRDDTVKGDVETAIEKLAEAEAAISDLEKLSHSRAVQVLAQSAEQLKESMRETTTECWDALVNVSVEDKRVLVQPHGLDAYVPNAVSSEISLEQIVMGSKVLGLFRTLLQKLGKDIDRAILRPRMVVDEDVQVAKVKIEGDEMSCQGRSNDVSSEALFKDLYSVLRFLAIKLPTEIAVPLSETLVPTLTSRLEEHWLDPAISISMSDTPRFEDLLNRVSKLADQISGLGWHGANGLRLWVSNAPMLWIAKRSEGMLGDVRDLVFSGLGERKVVERVETRIVSGHEAGLVSGRQGASGGGGEEDWDTAWDEADEDTPSTQLRKEAEEVDDASAWEVEDDAEEHQEGKAGEDGDEDAWGWGDGDDEGSQRPPSPIAARKSQPPPPATSNGEPAAEQEMTLRETFTVTAIPDALFSILHEIISDAQTLSGPDFAHSPIAPASKALYSLPTLALAIYRATASTAYAKLDVGNMLVYNDFSHLADQLRSWQASQPPASRLRLDGDVAALETVAKRAYAAEMEGQRTILRDLLDGAQGFSNCSVVPFKQACEGAMEGAVDRLRGVGRKWYGVLSQGARLQSLGALLATITGKMISEIEDLSDISEAESLQLKALCETVFGAKDLFTTGTEEGEGEGSDMTFVYCPTWLKFQYLAEIMEATLADIKWMWGEGELSLEFEAEEVVELVEALFAESEYRRRAVGEIRRGGRR